MITSDLTAPIEPAGYLFYTDGATSNNGAPDASGGWAWVLTGARDGSTHQLITYCQGHEDSTTNNRCELKAILSACWFVDQYQDIYNFLCYNIVTDSAYIVNCFHDKWYKKWQQNGWRNSKKKPVANRDLWEQLIPYFEKPNFYLSKCNGHSGNKWNEYADKLAVNAKTDWGDING